MKHLRYYIIYLLTAAGIFTACDDDLGNYNYKTLDELQISGIDSTLTALSLDNLTLKPVITGTNFNSSDYSYKWIAISNNDEKTVTELGDSLNLNYKVTLPSGNYYLYFKATNKKTGIFQQQSYKLTVSNTTSKGWLLLCSDNGRTRLDMISDITGKTYTDILAGNPDMPAMKGPRRIQQLNSAQTDGNSPFYLLTDDGATRLGKESFEWKPAYAMKYEMAQGIAPIPYSITAAGQDKMFVSGTQAYCCNVLGGSIGLYGNPVNKDFNVAPEIGANISATMYGEVFLLYDTTNRRFVCYAPILSSSDYGYQESLREINEMGTLADNMTGDKGQGLTGNAFDTFPTGYDYYYMENTKYDPGNGKMGMTYVILGKGDNRYVYGIQMGDLLLYSDATFVIGKGYYGDISACTDITKVTNKLYAFSSLRNCMYYAVGNTVYKVDLSEKPLKAERQFSLPGETITRLKFNLYTQDDNLSKSYNLVVASKNSKEGILRIYEGMESQGDFKDVTPEVHKGFPEIVDMTYREY